SKSRKTFLSQKAILLFILNTTLFKITVSIFFCTFIMKTGCLQLCKLACIFPRGSSSCSNIRYIKGCPNMLMVCLRALVDNMCDLYPYIFGQIIYRFVEWFFCFFVFFLVLSSLWARHLDASDIQKLKHIIVLFSLRNTPVPQNVFLEHKMETIPQTHY
uniref:Uncharacterized protein n=1 Tax=Gopherus agassizii TaxID=38772 RepID=A0A452I1E4_9SAUR